MKACWLGALLALLALTTLIAWALLRLVPTQKSDSSTPQGSMRLVSLAPAVTETLYYIGAGKDLVGVSDYCKYPPEAQRLPKVGTGITPNYEAIARLEPTLIVSEANLSSHTERLQSLAPTRAFPWLTLAEVVSSVRELGKVTGQSAPAAALAGQLERTLSKKPPPAAPRVLLVLGYAPGQLSEVWFIRRNSLHGAALHAAGGQNAVEREIRGAPRLSLQELLAVNPDMIVILTSPNSDAKAFLNDFAKLEPLAAVKSGRISVLATSDPYANGPRILDFVLELRAKLETMSRLDNGSR